MQVPQELKNQIADVQYTVIEHEKIEYLFFKKISGEALNWKERQELKNQVIGQNRTAVEFIFPAMSEKDVSVMICLPKEEFLDFGLN